MILLSVAAAFFYRRAVTVLLPSTPKLDIYGNMAKLILYPISSLRCAEVVSYHILSTYDPIAVAAAVCEPDDAARIAVREMVRLLYGSAPRALEDQTCAAIVEYRESRLRLIEWFCSEHNIPIGDWRSAPSAEDPGCLSYCPSCGVQYRFEEGVCGDCTGIVLQPLITGGDLQHPKRQGAVDT
jgi:hypothetical protein